MSNQLINKLAIRRSGNSGAGMTTVKFTYQLFLSFLAGLFSLSVNAAELTNIAYKTDSGYYDGSYGKGAYWVTPGLYSSMFSVGGKGVIDSNLPNSNSNKSLDSIREGTDKPKKYFIYSRYHLDQASDSIQIGHEVDRAETELMKHELRLPRKI